MSFMVQNKKITLAYRYRAGQYRRRYFRCHEMRYTSLIKVKAMRSVVQQVLKFQSDDIKLWS